MPSGWKKNAKYFNHLEMSHDEYVKKKKKFRNWKKKEDGDGKSFIDSVCHFNRDAYCQDLFFCQSRTYQYEPDILNENDKSMYSLYISKQNVKKSNNTFRKRGMGNMSRPNRWRKRQKENNNKYTKSSLWSRTNDKVYYNINDNYIKTVVKKPIKPKVQKDICSICCESIEINKLFTICCKKKSISSLKKNDDKSICSDCIKRVDTCPYCRSHELKYMKPKKNKKKKVKSKEYYEKVEVGKDVRRNISAYSCFKTRKHKNKRYPTKLLWNNCGFISTDKFTIDGLDFPSIKPIPLKLYKYYKNIEFTDYDSIPEDVYDAYLEIPYMYDTQLFQIESGLFCY